MDAFLAVAENEKNAESILTIAEKAEQNIASSIFVKYNSIVQAGEEVVSNLALYFGYQSDVIDPSLFIRNLLHKANLFLVEYAHKLQASNNKQDNSKILTELQNIQEKVVVFASSLKSAIKGEKLDWRNIPGVKEQNTDSSQLTAQEKEIMLQIFKANREGNYPPKLFEYTVKDFERTMNEPGHTFRLLYHNDSLLAFFHYDEDKDKNEIYVGSLNLNPNAEGTPIAVSMISEALREKPDANLKAIVWANNPARLWYTRLLGFKKIGETADYHNTGEPYWILEKPAQEKQEYLARAA